MNNDKKIRTMVAANQSGDVTLSWTSDEDDQMIMFINEKLAEGYVFFEVERSKVFFNLISRSRKKYISDAEQLNGREVTFKSVHDPAISSLLNKGAGSPVVVSSTPMENKTITMVKGLSDANEIAKKDTVMMKPVYAG